MNILRKIFHKEKKQEFNGDMKIYYRNLYLDLQEAIRKNKIDFYAAKGWFIHLPLRYANNTFNEKVNLIVDDCYKLLYEYCIKKRIINSNITYEEFYEGKGLYDKDYPISQIYMKHYPLRRLLD